MNLALNYLGELFSAARRGWNAFWFAPQDPATLGLIRILAGLMLLYTHAVWSLDLEGFFGPHGWVSEEAASRFYSEPVIGPAGEPLREADGRVLLQDNPWHWSYFWLIEDSRLLWTVHLMALGVFACLALGLFTTVMKLLAFLAAASYANRVPGALFGLDQINLLLAMYLAVGPCGAAYSLDRWWTARRTGQPLKPAPASSGANLAIRLIQVHMCIIYFFAGLSKLQGETWWHGSALWGAFANLEYQTLDMTWLADWPLVVALLTQTTVYWELSFCVLIWPRITRPLMLMIAVPLHLGIAFCMGMITFGLVMLIGCLSFVSPALIRLLLDRRTMQQGRAGEPEAKSAAAGKDSRRKQSGERLHASARSAPSR